MGAEDCTHENKTRKKRFHGAKLYAAKQCRKFKG